MQRRRLSAQRRPRVESLEVRRLLSVTPSDSLAIAPDMLAEGDVALASDADLTAPRVTSVRIGSQTWQSSFLDRIDPEQRAGFPMFALANPHASLPWTNIDQIQIQFSEDVGSTFDSSLIKIHGTHIGDYQSLFTANFDSNSNVATIQFLEPLHEDKLHIGIQDKLSDAAGNLLDGEWLDGGNQTMSGDGTAGGNFYFRINVLAGDLTGDGVVLGNDVTTSLRSRGKSTTDTDFDPRSDLDGSGDTTADDINMLVSLRGTWLPTGEPSPPDFPVAPTREIVLADDAQESQEVSIENIAPPLTVEAPAEGGALESIALTKLDNQPVTSLITDEQDSVSTTCQAIPTPAEPMSDTLPDIAPLQNEFLIYGPLQPDEYRLRYLKTD